MVDDTSTMFGPTPMRLPLLLLSICVAVGPAYAQGLDRDDGFDDRGVDRHDRAPDWNYRRGETEGKGAYYDGGRYGPRGLLGTTATADPWLQQAGDAARALIAHRGPVRANRWFAQRADRNRDSRLTDAEIGLALAALDKRASR